MCGMLGLVDKVRARDKDKVLLGEPVSKVKDKGASGGMVKGKALHPGCEVFSRSLWT